MTKADKSLTLQVEFKVAASVLLLFDESTQRPRRQP